MSIPTRSRPGRLSSWRGLPGCSVRSRGQLRRRREDTSCEDRRADADQRFFVRRAQQSRPSERKAMIDRSHALPITQQAKALGISRGSVYYRPRRVLAADLAVMRRIDKLHLEFPLAGGRMLRDLLNQEDRKSV